MKNPSGSFRWSVVILLFFATTINYLDRQVIGLLKPTLEQALNWTESDYSKVVMSFTAAYALGYIVFGGIIDKIGTKLGLSVSIVIWSIAAMLHAAARTTFGFGLARAALGLGEAGNFPASIKAVAEWFPKKERALATGIFNSGTNIGAVIAPIVVPWILGVYGWQMAFILTGAVGFIWLIFWWIMYEIPTRKKGVSQEELDYIYSDSDEELEKQDQTPVKWTALFGFRQTWTFVIGKFLTDPIWWFFLFWLPSYFSTTFDLDLKKPSIHLAVLYSFTTLGSIGGGYLSGWLMKKGWPVFKARKMAMLAFALMVVPIMAARYATDIWEAVLLISIAAAAHQAWSANLFTTVSDMFPKKAVSSVVGIGGMAGSLGGVVFPFFIGIILDNYKALGDLNGGYNIIFLMCGVAYLLAWGIMHLLVPRMERAVL
jgi:ACS family hexuronate transporter-like MFS transporter